MKIEQLKQKKIIILGFGREGIDTYLALCKLFPQKILAVADKKEIGQFDKKTQGILKKDKKIKLYLGKNYLSKIREYDLVIKTPGIPANILPKQKIRRTGLKVTSQTEIFFDNFPGAIIGVTGTKGKGTTASLIYAILKKAGSPVHLGGNIGKPVFQYLLKAKPSDIFVYELSSHQLQGLKKSPHIAVFLNLFRDHLDYYQSFNEYQKAKENIARYQTKNDFFVYAKSDKAVGDIAKKTKAKKIPFELPKQKISWARDILKSGVNPMNLMVAIRVAELFNVPQIKIKEGIKLFKSLPHRLNFVGKFRGIEFYDDSMATIPEATMAALDALGGKVKTLLVGGSEKGSDYNDLAEKILKSSIKNLIILGQGTGQKISVILSRRRRISKESMRSFATAQDDKNQGVNGKLNFFQADSMDEAVKIAYQRTNRGEACLLSPASASFNLFRDYHHRGMMFRQYVRKYANKPQSKQKTA